MSETVNTNHNQMGKLSNSGKSLVEEKEKFHRGKGRREGGGGVGFYPHPNELFLFGNEREALCNTEDVITEAA